MALGRGGASGCRRDSGSGHPSPNAQPAEEEQQEPGGYDEIPPPRHPRLQRGQDTAYDTCQGGWGQKGGTGQGERNQQPGVFTLTRRTRPQPSVAADGGVWFWLPKKDISDVDKATILRSLQHGWGGQGRNSPEREASSSAGEGQGTGRGCGGAMECFLMRVMRGEGSPAGKGRLPSPTEMEAVQGCPSNPGNPAPPPEGPGGTQPPTAPERWGCPVLHPQKGNSLP